MTELTMRDRLDTSKLIGWAQRYGVYVAMVLLFVFNAFYTQNFLNTQNLRVQLLQVTPIIIVSLGMALVIGTEGVDLSVGAIIALAGALLPLYIGYGPLAAMIVCIVGGIACGVVSGSLVAFLRIQPIVATLALMIGIRGLAVMINGSGPKQITDPMLLDLGSANWLGIPQMTWVAAVIVVIIVFLMSKTTFGRQLMSIGDSRVASALSGLPVKRVLIIVYAISGVLSAIAGVIMAGNAAYPDPSQLGLQFELFAITAVVVGGTPLSGGRVAVLGTVAGAIFMQLVLATLKLNGIQDSWQYIVQAVIIVCAIFSTRGRSGR